MNGRMGLLFWTCFSRGALRSMLIRLEVIMAYSVAGLIGKTPGIFFTLTALVARGPERSTANKCLLSTGLLCAGEFGW